MEEKTDLPDFTYLENKGYKVTNNQFKNLLAFLAIMKGEDVMTLLNTSPDYICEKFDRYIGSVKNIKDTDDHEWGINYRLRAEFIDKYCKRWGILKTSVKLNYL